MPASFIEIPIELLKFVRQSKLTSLQNNLWLYFHQLDHFGRSKYFLVNLEKIELTAEEKKAAYNLMIRLQVASYTAISHKNCDRHP